MAPSQTGSPLTTSVGVMTAPQPSVTTGTVGGTAANIHSMVVVTFAGTTGGVVLLTMMVCEQVLELPQSSVAMYVLVTM